MAFFVRLPSLFRGVPGRLGAVVVVASAFGSWALWPEARTVAVPPALTLDGKRADRLAFSGDETEIPVRNSRIYDTVAMFAQPQAEPRDWSAAPMPATIQEAGIRPVQRQASAPAPRIVKAPEKATRVASSAPMPPMRMAPSPAAASGDGPLTLLGWDVPGSRHLPGRKDAAFAFDKVSGGASALGTGTVRAVSRTASTLGEGLASAGGAMAETLGLK